MEIDTKEDELLEIFASVRILNETHDHKAVTLSLDISL